MLFRSISWTKFEILELVHAPKGFGNVDSPYYSPPKYQAGKPIWMSFSLLNPVQELFPELDLDSQIKEIKSKYIGLDEK